MTFFFKSAIKLVSQFFTGKTMFFSTDSKPLSYPEIQVTPWASEIQVPEFNQGSRPLNSWK